MNEKQPRERGPSGIPRGRGHGSSVIEHERFFELEK